MHIRDGRNWTDVHVYGRAFPIRRHADHGLVQPTRRGKQNLAEHSHPSDDRLLYITQLAPRHAISEEGFYPGAASCWNIFAAFVNEPWNELVRTLPSSIQTTITGAKEGQAS